MMALAGIFIGGVGAAVIIADMFVCFLRRKD